MRRTRLKIHPLFSRRKGSLVCLGLGAAAFFLLRWTATRDDAAERHAVQATQSQRGNAGNPKLDLRAGDEKACAQAPSTQLHVGETAPSPPQKKPSVAVGLNAPSLQDLLNETLHQPIYFDLLHCFSEGHVKGLNSEQMITFKCLMIETEQELEDLRAAAIAQGVTQDREIDQLMNDARAALATQLQDMLGVRGYDRYEEFERLFPQHDIVNQLDLALTQSGAKRLTRTQAQQLFEILVANDPNAGAPGQLLPAGGSARENSANFGSTVSENCLTEAVDVISPVQLQALFDLHYETPSR